MHRIVKVYNQKPGRDGLFGRTRTNRQGVWSISAMPNGDFYARVRRREEGTAGTTFVCQRDKSPTRHFNTA